MGSTETYHNGQCPFFSHTNSKDEHGLSMVMKNKMPQTVHIGKEYLCHMRIFLWRGGWRGIVPTSCVSMTGLKYST